MIVCNATPLIAFARIQKLDLLHQVVGELVIPKEVANEICNYKSGHHARINLHQEEWITIQAIQSPTQVQLLLPTLDKGEAEVIVLALEQQADLVLIDELTGRKVAESLGLNILGSVGVLIRAKQMHLIPAVKPLLEEMMQRGIHYNQRFITSILQQIGE